MNELEFTNQTMSSREIAEITGKQHKNVRVDVEKINKSYEKLGMLKIQPTPYTHPQNNQTYVEYLLTRIQTLDLMTGYNIELRIKVNRRWEDLEKNRQSEAEAFLFNPDTIIKLASNWKEEQQKRIEAETTVKELKPKALYADEVLTSQSCFCVTSISKPLGMSPMRLNKELQARGIQYRRGKEWYLYSKYQNKGFTKTRTHLHIGPDGKKHTSNQLLWTERGKLFIQHQMTDLFRKLV